MLSWFDLKNQLSLKKEWPGENSRSRVLLRFLPIASGGTEPTGLSRDSL